MSVSKLVKVSLLKKRLTAGFSHSYFGIYISQLSKSVETPAFQLPKWCCSLLLSCYHYLCMFNQQSNILFSDHVRQLSNIFVYPQKRPIKKILIHLNFYKTHSIHWRFLGNSKIFLGFGSVHAILFQYFFIFFVQLSYFWDKLPLEFYRFEARRKLWFPIQHPFWVFIFSYRIPDFPKHLFSL